jgi:outer membrane lipoprotein-sorting protein
MMNRLSLRVLSLFLTSLALSCSPRTSGIDLTRTRPEDIIQRMEMNHHEIATFQARGSISIESQEFTGMASITVSIKRPDSILMKIEGPFGIDIGSMLLTTERFTYYDSHANRVITGPTTLKNIRSILKVDLDFVDVMDVLSGATSLWREPHAPDSVSVDDDQLLFLFKNGSEKANYWVDPEKSVVVRYEVNENDKGPVLVTYYKRFRQFNTVFIPRSISILAQRENRRLSLYYDDIEINKPELDFTFVIPSNAKHVYW